MSEVRLVEAVIALDERKGAAGMRHGQPQAGGYAAGDPPMLGMIASDLDLDVDEVRDMQATVIAYADTVARADDGLDRLPVLAGSAWLDGILTGLLLARLRRERNRT